MPNFPAAQPIGALDKIIAKLRNSFPEKVDAAVLKKLAIAPNNETFIINTLRFLGVIDGEGTRTESAHDLFVLGDEDFESGFASVIRLAYRGLFDLHADSAWTLERPVLQSFFRTEDKSTELVGGRQADTFIRLAELAAKRESVGRGNAEAKRGAARPVTRATAKRRSDRSDIGPSEPQVGVGGRSDGGPGASLAVRIEVNLPPGADQDTYDKIFKSIRANLIDRG